MCTKLSFIVYANSEKLAKLQIPYNIWQQQLSHIISGCIFFRINQSFTFWSTLATFATFLKHLKDNYKALQSIF
jgi:hypothetical protein